MIQYQLGLGLRLLELKKTDEAKDAFEIALKLFEDISLNADSDRRVADATYLKSLTLYEMKKPKERLQQAEIALGIFQRSSDDTKSDPNVYKTLLAKGKCLIDMNKFEKATPVFIEAVKVYQPIFPLKQFNSIQNFFVLLKHISDCLINTKNFEETLNFLHKIQQLDLQRAHDTIAEKEESLSKTEYNMKWCLATLAK